MRKGICLNSGAYQGNDDEVRALVDLPQELLVLGLPTLKTLTKGPDVIQPALN